MGQERSSLRQMLNKMQSDDIVEVICYSGYIADESPREIILKGERYQVKEVITRRREKRGRRIYDAFACRVEDLIIWLERPEGGSWKIKVLAENSF